MKPKLSKKTYKEILKWIGSNKEDGKFWYGTYSVVDIHDLKRFLKSLIKKEK